MWRAELQLEGAGRARPQKVAALGYVAGLAGAESDARAAPADLERRGREGFVPAYDRALVHIGLGEPDAALDWLSRAYEERSCWLIYLKVDPALDPLRGRPRFAELLRRVTCADDPGLSAETVAGTPTPGGGVRGNGIN